ncbi:MAG: hypothetical protein R2850_13295 [Bacteroidia bacterium]
MKKLIFLFVVQMLTNISLSQTESIAIGEIDPGTLIISSKQGSLTNIVILEMNKLGVYQVLDRYDMKYLMKRDSIDMGECYSKICLTELGKHLKVDKMLTGNIQLLGDNILVSFRMIDVASGKIEKPRPMNS